MQKKWPEEPLALEEPDSAALLLARLGTKPYVGVELMVGVELVELFLLKARVGDEVGIWLAAAELVGCKNEGRAVGILESEIEATGVVVE